MDETPLVKRLRKSKSESDSPDKDDQMSAIHSTTTYSADVEWKLEQKPEVTPRSASSASPEHPSHAAQLRETFEATLERYHGPRQYLQHRYRTRDAKSDFAHRLLQAFPMRPDLVYCTANRLPQLDGNEHDHPLALHLAYFSFEDVDESGEDEEAVEDIEKQNVFLKCSLWKDGYTDWASQRRSRDMVLMDADSLSTDPEASIIQASEKYQQIGPNAVQRVLEASTGNIELSSRALLVVADLTPNVGETFDARLNLRKSMKATSSYAGVFASEGHVDWFLTVKKAELANEFGEGKLIINGFTPMASEVPSDLLETPPSTPQCQIMTWSSGSQPKLQLPLQVVNTWKDHAKYGEEFNDLVEKAKQDLGSSFVVMTSTEQASAGGDPEATTGPEIMLATLDISEMPANPLSTYGTCGVKMEVHVGERAYMVNRSNNPVSITAGTKVAGFGRGKLATCNVDELPADQTLFSLAGSGDAVLTTTSMTTIGDLYYEKVGTVPDAKVAYHELTENGNYRQFTLKRVDPVAFIPNPDEDDKEGGDDKKKTTRVNMNNGARLLPTRVWRSDVTDVVWQIRWSAAYGLAPAKPFVVVTKSVTIPAGKALLVTGDTPQ